jgi:hypothetical protein
MNFWLRVASLMGFSPHDHQENEELDFLEAEARQQQERADELQRVAAMYRARGKAPRRDYTKGSWISG